MQFILDIANKKQYVSKKINSLYMKRKNKLDYEFHKIASVIIQLCIENNIGNIIIGHNNNWKQETNMGKKNNQRFVQIPFNQLILILKYKCEENYIKFNLVEESYTSKSDHLVLEEMKHHEIYLGKRVKRGLFKSLCGKLLNADINGAIGILRKRNAISDEELFLLRNRGDVVSPLVLKY